MSATDANAILAAEVLAVLRAAGVRTLVVCPGGRNAPLVAAADAARGSFEVLNFFEERSAAFFALGRIRRDEAPAAVITTSGTAAAEMLPAMLEAVHAGWPLVAVTADRPRRLRGTGAPQTIDQLPIFAACGIPVVDADTPGQITSLPPGAVHLNVCFDEPLSAEPVVLSPSRTGVPQSPVPWMTGQIARRHWEDFFGRVRNPLVIVSSLTEAEARTVEPWLASLSSPLYLEAVSQLRHHRNLQEFSLHSGERILSVPECRAACDGILRIGGVPTPRFWRDLEEDPRPVLHVARTAFPGLARQAPVLPIRFFPEFAEVVPPGGDNKALFARDRRIAAATVALLAAEPHSEAALVRATAEKFAADARLLLGNSLAIREWDLAAPRSASARTFYANRGVNGIDGLVSGALGLAGAERPAAALIGDLSALYDLAGLWIAPQLDAADITIAVLNNGGGQIFRRMFGRSAFLNAHSLRLRGWADMFGWHYGQMRTPAEPWPTEGPRIVEILPDTEAGERFAEGYAALWR
ncbi:MAG: 2-succinyl-5-enolpyruvyl-6-hydroxy-3-cyclohexene-1-carboxylic-acid synthase [Chthoniobacterales bacterium]